MGGQRWITLNFLIRAGGIEAGEPNFVRRLPEQRAIYIRLGTVTNTETLRLVDLTRLIGEVMSEPGYDRIVLDLRDNAGGNKHIGGNGLRRAIMLSEYNEPGSLYVLIGPQTFSAGMNVATRFERDTFATFVGEPTGASPNSYGDHAFQIAQATGLGYMVSTLPWFDSMPMDEREWIMPDVAAPRTFDDWLAGHDAGLEAALAHTSDRDIEDFLLVSCLGSVLPKRKRGSRFGGGDRSTLKCRAVSFLVNKELTHERFQRKNCRYHRCRQRHW